MITDVVNDIMGHPSMTFVVQFANTNCDGMVSVANLVLMIKNDYLLLTRRVSTMRLIWLGMRIC